MNDIQEKDLNTPVKIKVSRLAIVAISLTLLGLILFVVGFAILINVPRPLDSTKPLYEIVFNISFFIFMFAIIFGFISYILIEKRGGKITGRNFAIGSIVISICICIFPHGIIFLRNSHQIAYRMVCGTNLSGLGKSMLIYANDYDDKFPFISNQNMSWGTSVKWDATTQKEAYGINDDGTGGSATISSSLYLLIKYMDVTPKSFICKGDKKMSLFEPEKYGVKGRSLADFWDFGPEPWKHYSFSYQMPFGENFLTNLSEPGLAVAADRNPWIASRGWKVKDFNAFDPDGDKEDVQKGNTSTHNNEGQNILYLDTHVEFRVESFCGVNEDNIYTSWDGSDIRKGTPPVFGSTSKNKVDSLLVNDPAPSNY